MLDNILFSTFYTGLFLLFREKTGGARAPLAPLLATALLLECCNACTLPQKATKVELTFLGTNKNGFTIKFVFMNKVAYSFEPSGTIEGVCGIRPQVTFDAMLNSPSHSQVNTRKFGRRIR